jgi:hypothetical protein
MADDCQNAEPAIDQSAQGIRKPESKGQEGLSPPDVMGANAEAIQQGNNDIARIHAGNAIRKEQERLNLLRLSSRIDAVASRVRTAVTMRSVGCLFRGLC